MKNILLSFSVIAIAVSFGACKKSNNGPSNIANVMFVDGCAGTTTVNVKANGTAVPGTSSIAFLANSGYQNVAGGSEDMIYYLNGLGTPLASGTVSLTANTHYSVFAGGLITGSSFVLTSDDLSAPMASTNAKVRFVNLSSDSLSESCYIGSQKLDSNVDYGGVTPFIEIAAATGVKILMQDPTDPTDLAELTNQNFNAGKIYTVMITGTASGTAASGLTLTVINNN